MVDERFRMVSGHGAVTANPLRPAASLKWNDWRHCCELLGLDQWGDPRDPLVGFPRVPLGGFPVELCLPTIAVISSSYRIPSEVHYDYK